MQGIEQDAFGSRLWARNDRKVNEGLECHWEYLLSGQKARRLVRARVHGRICEGARRDGNRLGGVILYEDALGGLAAVVERRGEPGLHVGCNLSAI